MEQINKSTFFVVLLADETRDEQSVEDYNLFSWKLANMKICCYF